MSIEVRGLTKIYGQQRAVNDISFQVGSSEIVGFLGPNGAGKSTTMKVIAGCVRPDAGQAFVCGIDVRDEPMASKRKIGYLPEANPLYHDMYVREFLGFIGRLHHIPNKKKRIDDLINLVGLDPEKTKRIGQLSKGYKQRVGLAAALLHEPEVLILDEPTSGLDPNQIVEIREVIKQLGKQKTVLFSSHILQEVEAVCDRAIIIHKGVLVADDQLTRLRQKEAGNTIHISFSEDVPEEWLGSISGVLSARSKGKGQWSLQCGDVAEAKKQLLELALQNNLNIVSLQSESQSLEDVFRSLTN